MYKCSKFKFVLLTSKYYINVITTIPLNIWLMPLFHHIDKVGTFFNCDTKRNQKLVIKCFRWSGINYTNTCLISYTPFVIKIFKFNKIYNWCYTISTPNYYSCLHGYSRYRERLSGLKRVQVKFLSTRISSWVFD